ncbi:hypothetical protein JOM56_011611 [Amanita muscaria]
MSISSTNRHSQLTKTVQFTYSCHTAETPHSDLKDHHDSDDSDDEFDQAVEALSIIGITNSTNGSSNSQQPLLESHIAVGGSDSTVSVIPSLETQAPSAFSVLTIRSSPSPNQISMATSPPDSDALSPPQPAILHGESSLVHNHTDILGTSSLMSIASLDSSVLLGQTRLSYPMPSQPKVVSLSLLTVFKIGRSLGRGVA